MDLDELYLDKLIGSQERAIRYYVYFTIGLACLGIGIMVFAYLVSNTILADAFKVLFGLGGGFISSLAGIQFKEIFHRRDKVEAFEHLKTQLKESPEKTEGDEGEDPEIREKIDDLLWQVIEKTALS